jgi:type IV pilus secretin PilQ/predicted competence protein
MNGSVKSCLAIACVLVAILYAPAGRKLLSNRFPEIPVLSASSLGQGDEALFLIHQVYWKRITSPASQTLGKGKIAAAAEEPAERVLRTSESTAVPQGFTGTRVAQTLRFSKVEALVQDFEDNPPSFQNRTNARHPLEFRLAMPVPVARSSFRSDAQSDLVAVASEDIPLLSSESQASTPKPAAFSLDQNVGPVDLQVSAPAAKQSSPFTQGLAASALAMDTPQDSIIAPPRPPEVTPRYTGKLVSLDLRNVDIRDFFRLIHRISGLNIVVDSDVTGRVTLVLDDVPWDQALDLVLKNNGLGRVLEGNVLRIATIKTLESEADETQELRDAKVRSEPLVTVVRRLHYASAEDQQPTTSSGSSGGMGGMSGMSGNMGGQQKPIPGVVTILKNTKGVLSPRGSVTSDSRDNAVIITDVPSQFPVIDALIDKLDTKSKQLSIQVRVVLASSDFTRSLSSVLSGAYGNKSGSTQTVGGTGAGIVGAPGAVGVPSSGSGSGTTTLSPAQTVTGFGAFAITNAGARYLINAALSAAEERDQARTISRPTIVTQDNFPGLVMQGVQIPIQTDINLTVAVQYVNAALEMMVTPRVTGDNRVFLDINVNNASPGTINVQNVGISINVQQATTKVLVPDGGTVVFGGITVTTRARSANYIPLLGSVPILGNLFKSSQVNDQNSELLFFVSPTVLPD